MLTDETEPIIQMNTFSREASTIKQIYFFPNVYYYLILVMLVVLNENKFCEEKLIVKVGKIWP